MCYAQFLHNIQLTGSGDATVRLWDVVGGVMLTEFKAHSASVKTVDIKTDEPSQSCLQLDAQHSYTSLLYTKALLTPLGLLWLLPGGHGQCTDLW